MASTRRREGPGSRRVADNVRRLRKLAGLTTYELADKLTAIGWPMDQSAVTRVEQGIRGVNVDDLLAFAIALDCSPNRLLLPGEFRVSRDAIRYTEAVVSPQTVADTADMWAWACGEQPLRTVTGPAAGKAEAVMFMVVNAPHRFPDIYDAVNNQLVGNQLKAARTALASASNDDD